jgi:EAL domain-containing protein (putative c-di-GMP-specific phosphodiesterase class I)
MMTARYRKPCHVGRQAMYLKRLPVDELKIDRTFVHQLTDDRDDAAIVRSTIALAHDLGLHVVAEDAETAAAYKVLGRFGCGFVQVYYISRPLSVADFA